MTPQVKVGWRVTDHLGQVLIDKEIDKVPADQAVELTTSLFDALEGEGPTHLSPPEKPYVEPPEKKSSRSWGPEEISVISAAATREEAVALYFKEFPDTSRTIKSVESAFRRYVAPEPDVQPLVDKCGEEQEMEEGLDDCEICDGVCPGCDKDSAEEFEDDWPTRNEFVPVTETTDEGDEIHMLQWQPPEPDNDVITQHDPVEDEDEDEQPIGTSRSWSDLETDLICQCPSGAEALLKFRDTFPDSERTDAAIKSRWYAMKYAGRLVEPPLRIDQVVRLNDPDLPQHGTTGTIQQLKPEEILVRFAHSTVWVSRSSLEVVSSASKK